MIKTNTLNMKRTLQCKIRIWGNLNPMTSSLWKPPDSIRYKYFIGMR